MILGEGRVDGTARDPYGSGLMRVVYFGSGEFAVPALRWLTNSPHEIAAVVTQPDRPAGRGKKPTATPVGAMAESLGAVESLIEHPGAMTHASAAGSPLEVPPSLIRLSVGIEHAADLVADLSQALDKVDR